MISDRALVLSWNLARKRLKRAKEIEMRFRKLCAARFFEAPKVGTNSANVSNTATLKLQHKQTYSLAPDADLRQMWEIIFNSLEPEYAAEIANGVIKTEYKLDEKAYKALPDALTLRLENEGFILIKNAAPTLTLTDPAEEFEG